MSLLPGTTATGWRVRYPSYTDEDLLTLALKASSPKAFPNLSTTPPPEGSELLFVTAYAFPEEVKCVWGHRHKKGFAFRGHDGKHYLVGHECGLKVLGCEHEHLTERSKAEWNRQFDLLRLQIIGNAIEAEIDWLRALPDVTLFRAADVLRKRLREFSSDFFSACHRIAVSRGVIYGQVRVRDFAAEEAHRERMQRDADRYNQMENWEQKAYLKNYTRELRESREPKYTVEYRQLGYLRARRLFFGGGFHEMTVDYVRRLETVARNAVKLPATGDLVMFANSARALVEEFEALLRHANEVCGFFDPPHLDLLARLGNEQAVAQFAGQKYSTASGQLRLENEGNGVCKILRRPEGLHPMSLDPLDRMKRKLAKLPTRPK